MLYLYKFKNKLKMIEIELINKSETFKNIHNKKSQIDYYIENNAHPDIIKIVSLNNKSFGEVMQRIIKEFLKLDNPIDSGHDIYQKSSGVKFEVKSSRYWVTNKDWKWQHIMEYHDYDYVLFCGINFNGIDLFIISKSDILKLKDEGLVTKQGGSNDGHGLWCNYNNIKEYITPIKNIEELNDFIK